MASISLSECEVGRFGDGFSLRTSEQWWVAAQGSFGCSADMTGRVKWFTGHNRQINSQYKKEGRYVEREFSKGHWEGHVDFSTEWLFGGVCVCANSMDSRSGSDDMRMSSGGFSSEGL